MKSALLSLIFLTGALGFPSAEAYPWVNFRQGQGQGQGQGQEKGILELEGRFSQFKSKDSLAFVSADFDYSNPTLDIDAGLSWSFYENKLYIRPSSLAVIFPDFLQGLSMSLGLKDTVWSKADRYWNYGLFQPRYMLDHFRPAQMGLPGVYFDYKQENSSLKLLLSWFNFFDFQYRHDISEGRIDSKNPFFNIDKFVSNVSLENISEDKLRYRIQSFLKPALVFQLQHALGHSRIAFSYAYKPINRIQYQSQLGEVNVGDLSSMPLKGDSSAGLHNISQASELETFDLSALSDMPSEEGAPAPSNPSEQARPPQAPAKRANTAQAPPAEAQAPPAPTAGATAQSGSSQGPMPETEIDMKPKIKDVKYYLLSHHLIGLEGEIALSKGFSLLGGFFYELPEKKPKETGWQIVNPLDPNLNLSLIAFLEEELNNRSKTLFTLGWTKTIKNRSREIGKNEALSGGNLLFFQSALSASVEYQDQNVLEGFLARFRANHALDNSFSLLSLEKELSLSQNLRVIAGGDLIFRLLNKNKGFKADSSHVKAYKSLSRLLVGGKYVF